MSKFHFGLLNNHQQNVWQKLGVFRRSATLAGGTALALQIGHRYSADFDVFFARPLVKTDVARWRRAISVSEVGLRTSEQINLLTRQGVRINLVFYPFRHLWKKVRTDSLSLFSVSDIALDKAYTIGRRATWRDYVDMFFLLRKGHATLEMILRHASKKFGVEFNEKLFLEQLAYFEDIEAVPVAFTSEQFTPARIKQFLIHEVKKYRRKVLG